MRLRSSQFVFLMLLVCSVQVKAEVPTQRIRDLGGSRFSFTAQHHEGSLVPSERIGRLCLQLERLSPALRLDPAAAIAERTPWSMASPARSSTAVVSFTSLLRS